MRGRAPRRTGQTGFTETVEQYQHRVKRDRLAGTAVLGLAVAVFLLNLVMEFAASLVLLPGEHSELYFLAAVLVGGAASWVTFDLGLTRRQRR